MNFSFLMNDCHPVSCRHSIWSALPSCWLGCISSQCEVEPERDKQMINMYSNCSSGSLLLRQTLGFLTGFLAGSAFIQGKSSGSTSKTARISPTDTSWYSAIMWMCVTQGYKMMGSWWGWRPESRKSQQPSWPAWLQKSVPPRSCSSSCLLGSTGPRCMCVYGVPL